MKGLGMTMIKATTVVVACVAFLCAQLETQSQAQRHEQENPAGIHALIVGGMSKDPQERQAKDDVVSQLRTVLEKDLRLSADRLIVLVDEASSVRRRSGRSTAANLKDVFDRLVGKVKPSDVFIFYYTGQANIVAGELRFNVRGPDFTHEELAELIDHVASSMTLVVLDCPGAGLAVKSLTGESRIVICAARSDQPYSTRFSAFFVPALVNPESDTDGDGRVSVLEAFERTAAQVDEFYSTRGLMCTETPLLEDNGDGVPSQQPWQRTTEEKDGLVASRFFLFAHTPESSEL